MTRKRRRHSPDQIIRKLASWPRARSSTRCAAIWRSPSRRQQLERQLGRHVSGDQLTSDQVKALVTALKDIVAVLANAEAADKSELYDQLGIRLTYNADGTPVCQGDVRQLR